MRQLWRQKLWFSISNEGTEAQSREKMAEPGRRAWSALPTAPAPRFLGVDVCECVRAGQAPASFSRSLGGCTWVEAGPSWLLGSRNTRAQRAEAGWLRGCQSLQIKILGIPWPRERALDSFSCLSVFLWL